jgi:hypothetical protein
MKIHALLLAASLAQAAMFFSCASAPRLTNDEETCQVYTQNNASICDPDGDLANGDFDAAE